MRSTDKAYLYAGLAVLFWSTVATAFKIALRGLDFIQLIFFASAVTVVILLILLLLHGKFKQLFSMSRKEVIYSLMLGAVNPAGYYIVLFKAYSLLPAQVAQPVNMVWPVVLTLLSVPVLGQKIGRLSIAGLLISFTGVVFISLQGGADGFRQTSVEGVLLALGSSFLWALYWILNVRNRGDALISLFLNFFSGLIILTVVMILFSDFKVIWDISLLAAAYVGIFETGITYIFWMKAMLYSSNNARIGNLIYLTPFISLIFIRFILKETLYLTTFTGLIFIVTGILVQRLDKKNYRLHAKSNN
jgi:drug/metabolite transporter (DMT)-like permease